MAIPHEHLYEVPIEELGLSDGAIRALKIADCTSIGDCIDFYRRGMTNLVSARPAFFVAMTEEVMQKVKEQGYWSYVEAEGNH